MARRFVWPCQGFAIVPRITCSLEPPPTAEIRGDDALVHGEPFNRGTTSMNTHAPLADRLRRGSASHACRAAGAWMTRLLSPPTPQELERRRAHLFALLLVAVVATAKHVTGVTDGSASYTVYVLAIAVSAL